MPLLREGTVKVWVLMTGAYDAYELEGLFTTAEAARQFWTPHRPDPVPKKYVHPTRRHEIPTYEWSKEKDGSWWFDGGMTHCASLQEVEVRDGSPI